MHWYHWTTSALLGLAAAGSLVLYARRKKSGQLVAGVCFVLAAGICGFLVLASGRKPTPPPAGGTLAPGPDDAAPKAPDRKGGEKPARYTTYPNFIRVMEGHGARYPALRRVSDPGTREHPLYTGFFFYQCLQFDQTGRYLLGMRVDFDKRRIRPDDRAVIGVIDLRDRNRWTTIGTTTAWNWQQGARLQWRPESEEIVWNDRSDDGKTFVCRVYDFRTGKLRTLPRPIYDLSPDGRTALTHDFEGDHQGTDYAATGGEPGRRPGPGEAGIWKMKMDTGEAELIMPLDRMAAIAFPRGVPKSGRLYIFREGWNPSGKRFISFIGSASRCWQGFSAFFAVQRRS